MASLHSQIIAAQAPAAANKVKSMRTDTGLKDTFQNFFINQLLDSYKKRRGVANKQAALNSAISGLPQETMSPVWRLRGDQSLLFFGWSELIHTIFITGLDPHSDTPVEILHVVLLGFVKYLWRDVIQNQIKKNVDKEKELEIRLSSINVSGLGLDAGLSGHTLVNYCGSLTGG